MPTNGMPTHRHCYPIVVRGSNCFQCSYCPRRFKTKPGWCSHSRHCVGYRAFFQRRLPSIYFPAPSLPSAVGTGFQIVPSALSAATSVRAQNCTRQPSLTRRTQLPKQEDICNANASCNDGILIRSWDGGYAQLVAYKAKIGNCDVPYHSSKRPALGKWVGDQRKAQLNKTLSTERTSLLEEIGLSWTKKTSLLVNGDKELRLRLSRVGHRSNVNKETPAFVLSRIPRGRRYSSQGNCYTLKQKA